LVSGREKIENEMVERTRTKVERGKKKGTHTRWTT